MEKVGKLFENYVRSALIVRFTPPPIMLKLNCKR